MYSFCKESIVLNLHAFIYIPRFYLDSHTQKTTLQWAGSQHSGAGHRQCSRLPTQQRLGPLVLMQLDVIMHSIYVCIWLFMLCLVIGMAHRDLKPENILCEHGDRVSLSLYMRRHLRRTRMHCISDQIFDKTVGYSNAFCALEQKRELTRLFV